MSASLVNGLIGGASGAVAVSGAWVYAFISDAIVSRKNHQDALVEKDKQITEWKEIARLAEQRADLNSRRADAATEAANTANLLLAGIRRGISDA